MKKNYLIIALLFSAISFGQNFTNAGGAGNGLWSTATNWSTGVLPTASATIAANVNLDANYTLTGTVTSGLSTISGLGKLTLTTTTGIGLLCNGANFTYDAGLEFNSGGTAVKALQVNNASGNPLRELTMGPLSVLNLKSPASAFTQNTSKITFRGKITSDPNINLLLVGTIEFATTSDNTGFDGDMIFQNANINVTANTTGAGAFLKAGRKVQVNNNNCSLTINGANSYNGNISVATTNAFALNINADQGSFGSVTVGNGPLTINVAAGVTNLSFTNSSGIAWGSGTLAFTGYQAGEIRFGTSKTALTASQLSKITADGAAASQAMALDANGYLVTAASLVTNWTGGTSTTWTDATNWSNGVPNSGSNVTIGTGTFQPIIVANASINALTIASGATLNVATGNLTVTGAIANSGTMTMANNTNLLQAGTTNTNTGNITVNKNSNQLFREDYTMWSSPVAGAQTLLNFSPATLTNRFYIYDYALGPNTGLYAAVASPSTTTFTTGNGYLIRMPDTNPATNYDAGTGTLAFAGAFTGTPNNGTITLSSLASDEYYAVGNPYPSTIGAQLFLNGNTTDGVLYFWRKKNGAGGTAYATFTNGGGTSTTPTSAAPDGTIAVGQGFIVKTGAAATTLTFTNSMRTGNTNAQFFKTKQLAQKDHVWFNLTSTKGVFSQALVAYIADASQGLDQYDGKYINDSPVALTSSINNEEYTIQGRPAFDTNDILPLNFKTNEKGDFTIAIDHVDGLFSGNQDIYLLDSKTGIETNLKTGSYDFTAEAGIDNARFTVKYQKTLSIDAPSFDDNSISVYATNGTLYVNSKSVAINNIKVFDVQGRLLAEQRNVKSTTAVISNLRASKQVLIVKITGEDNNEVSRKIMN